MSVPKIHIPAIPPKKLPYIAIREKTKKHDCYERLRRYINKTKQPLILFRGCVFLD